MRNKVVNLHAINPRILVNLPLILVKTLANLLVKPTKLELGGAIGALGPGNTLGRGSYDLLVLHNGARNTACCYETIARNENIARK